MSVNIPVPPSSLPLSYDITLPSEADLNRLLGIGRDHWLLAIFQHLLVDARNACDSVRRGSPSIQLKITEMSVSIADNGDAILGKTLVQKLLGQAEPLRPSLYPIAFYERKGETLRNLLAAGLNSDGKSSCIHIESCAERHVFKVNRENSTDVLVLTHDVEESDIMRGTRITFFYPELVRAIFYSEENNYSSAWLMAEAFAAFNPHVQIDLLQQPDCWGFDEVRDDAHRRWRFRNAPSPFWYSNVELKQLVDEIAYGGHSMTIADFLSRFAGLSDSSLQNDVFDMARLEDDMRLSDLNQNADKFDLGLLLLALQTHGAIIMPEELGVLGKDIFECYLDGYAGALIKTYYYLCLKGFDTRNLPYVLELGFVKKSSGPRTITTGINFSAYIENPVAELNEMLDGVGIPEGASAAFVVHFACPTIDFTDTAKTRVRLPPDVLQRLNAALAVISKRWHTDAVQAPA